MQLNYDFILMGISVLPAYSTKNQAYLCIFHSDTLHREGFEDTSLVKCSSVANMDKGLCLVLSYLGIALRRVQNNSQLKCTVLPKYENVEVIREIYYR